MRISPVPIALAVSISFVASANAQEMLPERPPGKGSDGATITDPVTETFCKHFRGGCKSSGKEDKDNGEREDSEIKGPKPKDAPEETEDAEDG